jgi:AcrR family transcriptional regulator
LSTQADHLETIPKRRPYMRASERRRHLLDAAARIAGREGLGRLTMVGVATEAGVSRQLVYEHFADLGTLVWALVVDRFGAAETTIASALGARLLLSLPREHRHLVRSLVAYASLADHELSGPAARLRGRMIKRWTTALAIGESRGARARVWALLQSLFGLGDLLDARELSLDEALAEFGPLLRAALTP